MSFHRVFWRRLCVAAALGLLGSALHAQNDGPQKLVKFVVDYPPGGPIDIIARSLGSELQLAFKQPANVENKPGASGNIGADQAAKSAADGYTVLLGIESNVAVKPHIYPAMPWCSTKRRA